MSTNTVIVSETNYAVTVDESNNITVEVALPSVGPSGPIGYTGSVGPAGVQGPTGNTGFTGSVGYTGSVGPAGTQGTSGFTGYVGSQGVKGYDGSVGYTGSIGFTGSTGYVGSAGVNGTAGFVGSVGYTGSKGTDGTNGYHGSIGYTGSAGYVGSQGLIGYTGSAAADTTQRVTGYSFYDAIPKGTLVVTMSDGSGAVIPYTGIMAYVGSGQPTSIIGVSEADIPRDTYGNVVTTGLITGIDTSAYTVFDTLYAADGTSNGMTATPWLLGFYARPSIRIGQVMKVGVTDGAIFVNITGNFDKRLMNLDDVGYMGSQGVIYPSAGQVLRWDQTVGVWAPTHIINDASNVSTTAGWSASKIFGEIGYIGSALDAIIG